MLQLSRQPRRRCLRARLSVLTGEVLKTFPHIEDQLRWVYGGTDAYVTAGMQTTATPSGRAAHTSQRHEAPCQAKPVS